MPKFRDIQGKTPSPKAIFNRDCGGTEQLQLFHICLQDKFVKKHKNRKGETKRWQLRLILSPVSLEPVKLH